MTEQNSGIAIALASQQESAIISSLVLNGDLSKLTPDQQVKYYNLFCESLGLNPLTKPFDIVNLQNKKVLYANKNCAEQLRRNNGVSFLDLQQTVVNDECITTVKGQDKTGRVDVEVGVVNVKGLSGDALANAMMKSATKAKRRMTLSICSVGVLDETELETIPGAERMEINITGAAAGPIPGDAKPSAAETSPLKSKVLSEAAYSQLVDMMNAMGWNAKRQTLVFQKAELVGEEKAVAGVQAEYKKWQAGQNATSSAPTSSPSAEGKPGPDESAF